MCTEGLIPRDMRTRKPIPVIDLFAGPGGLGEGFSSLQDSRKQHTFRLALSIEMDKVAHQTLLLRSIFRRLKKAGKDDVYYKYVSKKISKATFHSDPDVAEATKQAEKEAKQAELGVTSESEVDAWIKEALDGAKEWVLIGGPPCQAYSLVGRARRRHDPNFSKDKKHLLYREYLRIIRVFQPSVFVMENVKGLLSSKKEDNSMFELILADLREPAQGLHYGIRSFVSKQESTELTPSDFVVRAERYGVPQERHRVVLLGVRTGIKPRVRSVLTSRKAVTVKDAIATLPRRRSNLSTRSTKSKVPVDTPQWQVALKGALQHLSGWSHDKKAATKKHMSKAVKDPSAPVSTGHAFDQQTVSSRRLPGKLAKWLLDPKLGGVIQHTVRSHMAEDLHRYLFLSAFARAAKYSPTLDELPSGLLPKHKNAKHAKIPFKDRFKVQLNGHPASTITAHISKDGHYYIHPDPGQCRSLTVREAARLQTFPDNYFFEGPRTEQYRQVGNAVPPFLALQLATAVARLMGK